jgi:hypothetical protein
MNKTDLNNLNSIYCGYTEFDGRSLKSLERLEKEGYITFCSKKRCVDVTKTSNGMRYYNYTTQVIRKYYVAEIIPSQMDFITILVMNTLKKTK